MNERGISFLEILILLVIVSLVAVTTTAYVREWLDREAMRSAVYQVQTHIQMAKVLAVTRNRPCRFVINEISRRIQVFDLMDPGDTSDDVELANFTLSKDVFFNRPDAGSAITLASLGPDTYGATFDADGTVNAGTGDVVLQGADRYDMVSLYGAGGVRIRRWNGSAWVVGS